MTKELLRAEKLVMAAGARTLCRNLDVAFEAGQLWGVLGCNGSGKTTLLHTLAGLAPAVSGRVIMGDRPLGAWSRRELACALGILLQHEEQAFWGSLADYVMLGRYARARSLLGPRAEDEQATADAIAAFELTAIATQPFSTLSGGERQRARLAQLWAQQPGLLLLDEPLQHLDLRHQLRTLKQVREAVQSTERAAVMVIHDLAYATRCDRILMLFGDGRHATGSAAELLQIDNLETLYGCRVRAFGNGADAHFMPVI